MRHYINILKALLPFLILGILLRLVTLAICYPKLSNLPDLFIALLTGCIYDFSFLSIVLMLLILLNLRVNSASLNKLFYMVLVLWILLNAVDVISFNYTSVRAGVNLLSLFSFGDLLGKIDMSFITLGVVLFFTAFSYALYKKRHRFNLPLGESNGKQKLVLFFIFASISLLYTPYPLNYYSDQINISKEMRQLAVNPFFSWGTSIINPPDEYPMDIKTALVNYKNQMHIPEQQQNFISRKVDYSNQPSYKRVIVILMESFGSARIGALNGKKSLSPNFDSLSKEGTLYTRCFSCGPRTQFAVSSVLYGFPHILQYNLFRNNKQKLPFHGLIKLLSENGYRSHFLHGGEAKYDDMDLLMRSNDSLSIKDANNITNFEFRNKWGVDDGSFFKYSADYISKQNDNNFYCMLTMTNHGPWELPKSFVLSGENINLSEAEKTFLYSDKALGNFIDDLKQKQIYDNSLIIITGDHGESYGGEDNETKIFNVPLLIIDHASKGVNHTPCSHADIAEYVLSRTGYKGNSHLTGQGLVGGSISNIYYRSYENELYKVTDSVIYRCNLNTKQLFKITCENNLYVKSIDAVDSDTELYKQITSVMLSYYCVNRFIFESGFYQKVYH